MTTQLSKQTMRKMLELFNHRYITVERDGYPEQAFEVHFQIQDDPSNEDNLLVAAFEKTAQIYIDTKSNQVNVYNTVYDAKMVSTFISSFDSLLYTYHLICILANSDRNNAMFVLTVLPTVFTILLKIYEELPDNSDGDIIEACKEILTHTQNICFDHNSIVISRKKL